MQWCVIIHSSPPGWATVLSAFTASHNFYSTCSLVQALLQEFLKIITRMKKYRKIHTQQPTFTSHNQMQENVCPSKQHGITHDRISSVRSIDAFLILTLNIRNHSQYMYKLLTSGAKWNNLTYYRYLQPRNEGATQPNACYIKAYR